MVDGKLAVLDGRTPIRHAGFADLRPLCNCAAPNELDGCALEGITEADLKVAIEKSALRVARVLVVNLAASNEFAVYLRFVGTPGYQALLKRRREGIRTWTDFRNLRTFIQKAAGYRGPYLVYPEGWPLLERLGISAP